LRFDLPVFGLLVVKDRARLVKNRLTLAVSLHQILKHAQQAQNQPEAQAQHQQDGDENSHGAVPSTSFYRDSRAILLRSRIFAV
jgi:hypothetical protein